MGIRILSVTEPNDTGAGGNMSKDILGLMAQFDNKLKSKRVKLGIKKVFSMGRWL